MVCFYHPDRPAIGICKYCQRGLCIDCAAFVNDSLTCKDRHEDQVRELNLMAERGILQAKRVGSGYTRNVVFYFLVGALFAGFGLLQYRFLGLQAIFFILIGLLLLYAAAANFVERKKYKLSLRLSITYCVYRVETKRSKEMNTGYKQLTRSTTNHMIAGVCGGLGFYSNIDPTVIRLAAVLLLFLTGPGIVVAYILMALIVPEDPERQT